MNVMMIYDVIGTLFNIYKFLIFGYILLSWFPQARESPVRRAMAHLVEPYLSVFRSIIPPLGMLDISPIIALFALQFIEHGVYFILEALMGL
ncbi:membrane protein [Marinithermofilum abyssi]|uniref:Membrane protein n=1 Tax=Marinithermofilum abyssi TaxID=1571185 RepID=A0A8J2VD53_9BACL|nr:YggT family protein [Marinithermofilum abyssi]GGE22420.1 membrane protein [Marinithermofilum abyssi]